MAQSRGSQRGHGKAHGYHKPKEIGTKGGCNMVPVTVPNWSTLARALAVIGVGALVVLLIVII